MWYYTSTRDDSEVISKLNELAQAHPTRGFGVYFGRLRNQGIKWNHKRVKRVYNLMGLNLRRKRKRRLPARAKEVLEQPTDMNITWSIDFMCDSLITGRKFRVLNILDDYNREILGIEVDSSLPSERVIRVLEDIIRWRGKPTSIRSDNGPEFISNKLFCWCEKNGIAIKHIQPGKPTQNAFVERFNRLFREDVLDAYLFYDLNQVRELAISWMDDYNANHPHESLNKLSPWSFAALEGGRKSLEAFPSSFNESIINENYLI
jgi:putative transposase